MSTHERGDEREAFEAGASGRFSSFESWYNYFYICQDCRQDTAQEQVHQCPAKLKDPYRR